MAREPGTIRNSLTGFVLAGGASRRMGRDKAQIPWGRGTLLIHGVERMKRVMREVFVVGTVAQESVPVPVLVDKLPGLGPLAGVHAALSHSVTDWNLILAVDLPLVPPKLLAWIADLQADSSALAIVLRVKSQLQPLCAAYHRGLLPDVEKALANRELSIHRLLERLSTRIIEEDQLIASGFVPEMLLNVNTPEDMERARAVAKTMYG